MSELYDKAFSIAEKAHANQLDKAGKPYILHSIRVASLVDTEIEKAVALLHDVLEDSEVTAEQLRLDGMPNDVVDAVELLTKPPNKPYFDYLKRVKDHEVARKVKIADLTHNSDLSRLETPTRKDQERTKKYKEAIKYLSL